MKVTAKPNETNADSVGNLIRPSYNSGHRSSPMEVSPIKSIKDSERSKPKTQVDFSQEDKTKSITRITVVKNQPTPNDFKRYVLNPN